MRIIIETGAISEKFTGHSFTRASKTILYENRGLGEIVTQNRPQGVNGAVVTVDAPHGFNFAYSIAYGIIVGSQFRQLGKPHSTTSEYLRKYLNNTHKINTFK